MENTGGTQTQEELNAMVAEQLGGGKNRTEVIRELVESGMTESEAQQTVGRILLQLKKTAAEEEFSGEALVPALLGGILAAVVGGAVWAAVGIFTEYELGILAWGIGVLCGLGVVMFARGKKGMPLQIVAVVTSVLGVIVGKYGYFYYYFQQELLTGEGGSPELAAEYSWYTVNMITVFVNTLPEMLTPYDILWVGLAMYSAWSIPKASGLKI